MKWKSIIVFGVTFITLPQWLSCQRRPPFQVKIQAQKRPAMFPIVLWNHYWDALDKAQKTTNCAEGLHISLRANFLSSHPSIWNMVRGLKKDMAIQRLIVLNAEVEHNDRPKMKYKNLAVRLSEKVAKYEDEQDKLIYLRGVAFIS